MSNVSNIFQLHPSLGIKFIIDTQFVKTDNLDERQYDLFKNNYQCI